MRSFSTTCFWLAMQPHRPIIRPRFFSFQALQCTHIAEHALLGVLTHGAGIEEDEVCILGLIAQAVADIHQHALDALAIVDVLLTAIAVHKGQRRVS